MTDIEPIPIDREPSRLEDNARFFETYQKASNQTQYSFRELIACRLYDTTTQTPSSWTYTYQAITQNGWFTYVSGVLTIPKASYYYVSSNLELNGGGSVSGDNFTQSTGLLLCNISAARPPYCTMSYKRWNTAIVSLQKGQTITITYTQNGATSMKWNLYIYEINPLALIIK